ncbi:hypothetical protein BDV95DRAFT_588208 [Massariosphaeria phaeospora]|uniref:Cupin type-1 domain-containing protein n=1 Tax=Massariosphaeria phaeospora TaxID=100035 RepID=A0A7C8ME95_9PLEO|nr:hypothetical protein BDV95DRAFT_588208 [Massariosphaeria phaeospora]
MVPQRGSRSCMVSGILKRGAPTYPSNPLSRLHTKPYHLSISHFPCDSSPSSAAQHVPNMSMASPPRPEEYRFAPTSHVPNSRLPVLIYRGVLPDQPTAASTREALEKNAWLEGGVFKTVYAHHFHSVTHECYAVFHGSSRLLLGRGPVDDPGEGGVEVSLSRGDIIVLPAGVSHCSVSSEDEYEYVGLYPKGSPHWDNNFCKADAQETAEKAKVASSVPIPDYDPVYGKGGPLVDIWRRAIAT